MRIDKVLAAVVLLVGSLTAQAQSGDPDLARRVLALEVALAEMQGIATRATQALMEVEAYHQQVGQAKEMAASAVNGQNEVLRKAQAIVDRASGSRAELEGLKSRLAALESAIEEQRQNSARHAVMDDAPAGVPQPILVGDGRGTTERVRIVHLGQSVEGPAPAAASIGPCPALMAGSVDAWQAALDGFGVGLIFESVDLDAQMALIRTSAGNREAIAAGDLLARSGCL